MRFAVDDLWIGHRLGPTLLEQVDDELRPVAFGRTAVQRARVPKLPGALMPGIVDRHVHLGLVDAAALAETAVVEVHDLGWVPRIARGWKIDPPTGGVVKIAGPFLTAIGGYPADRAWAPSESVRELTGPADGIRAVDEGAAYRHDLIKVVLHSGGPLLDDATLAAVVRAAHRHQLPVGVHAEGEGQARRAFEAGADILVHAPWTESLSDDLLRAMAGSMRWISTFAIHRDADRDRAVRQCPPVRPLWWAAGLRHRHGERSNAGWAAAGGDHMPWARRAWPAMHCLSRLTGPPGDRLQAAAAVYAPLPLPDGAAELAVWMNQARRLAGALEEGAMTA